MRPTRISAGIGAVGMLVAAMTIPVLTDQASAASPTDWATTRLVPNSGFEAASGLSQWQSNTAGGSTTVINGGHGSTAHAARLTDSDPTKQVSLRSSFIAVVPGEELIATGWARPNAQRAGSLYVEFWNGASPRARVGTTSISVSPTATVNAWAQLTTAPLVAPDDAVVASVLIYSPLAAGSSSSPAVTDWDDVGLTTGAPSMRKVPNADFEESREFDLVRQANGSVTDPTETDNAPTQWKVTAPGGTALARSSAAFTGDHGLLINDSSGGAGESVIVTSRSVPLEVGETVQGTVWGRSPSSTAVGTMAVEGLNASGAVVGTPALHRLTGSSWQRLSGSVTGTSTIKSLRIKLYTTAAEVGQAYWDSVSLRSSKDESGADATTYDPTLVGQGSVLSVGDLRVESYSDSVTRPVQTVRGAPIGLPDFPDDPTNFDDANARLFGTVLCTDPSCSTLTMWYTANAGNIGYATSSDAGSTWVNHGPTRNTVLGTAETVSSVVPKQGEVPGVPTSAAYLGLRNIDSTDQRYEAMWSSNGIDWTPIVVPGASSPVSIQGFDVSNVTYDDQRQRYVATVKEWATTAPRGPRTVWVSTSTDFTNWSAPTPALAGDNTDYTNTLPTSEAQLTSDIYGMPAIRYGSQLIGMPWVFDITTMPYPTGNPGPDQGPAKVELATSADGINWSRPVRTPLIARGDGTTADGKWDLGFHTSSTQLVGPMSNGKLDLYYSASEGPHAAAIGYTIGRVSWDVDRFQSWHVASGDTGTVTTRTLDLAAGATIKLNAKTASTGSLRIDILEPDGSVRTGCEAGATVAASTDAKNSNRATPTFAPTCSVAGEARLRFTLSGADLFSYALE